MKSAKLLRLFPLLMLVAISPCAINAQMEVKFKHVQTAEEIEATEDTSEAASKDLEENNSLLPKIDSSKFIVRSVPEIIASLGTPDFRPVPVNKALAPWVFSGYRNIPHQGFEISTPVVIENLMVRTNTPEKLPIETVADSVFSDGNVTINVVQPEVIDEIISEKFPTNGDINILSSDVTPRWLRNDLNGYRIQEEFMYENMVANPRSIEYAYWELPERPKLPEEEVSFANFIKKLDLPDVDTNKAELMEKDIQKIHWLHTVNSSMQFSQAYLSPNWYQGGNNHLALLLGFNWNVQLNQVYHPNLMLQSNLSYKLGLNSTPQDTVHKYSISEDLLQYNLNAGLKAFKKWYYSFNLQFKTQLLNNYPTNSDVRRSAFMSPGNLNVGLGMAYNHVNKPKTLSVTATISPISYNLKTCIDTKVNPKQFGIEEGKKTLSEIGSNAEINMKWQMKWNITYSTRLFLFTDYKYFLGDWQNTFNFEVNKFLSTQIFLHMRYDTSRNVDTSWKKFQLHEVFSFGLSYTFATKK